MTISISVDRILREIYALSALRSFNSQNQQQIPILTPDQRRALTIAVSGSITHIAISLHGFISSIDFSDKAPDEIDIVTLDITAPSQSASISILRAIELAILHHTLASILIDQAPETSRLHLQLSANSIDNVRFLASLPPDTFQFSITPHS